MVTLITEDDIDELELRDFDERAGSSTGGVAEHLEKAAIFESWATDADAYTLDDGVTPAQLLIVAAEHLQMGRDYDEAFRLALAAAGHPSAQRFEAHPTLISLHLELDQRAEALALADEVRTAGAPELGIYEAIASSFEIADELALAERWYAIALRALDKVNLESPADRLSLLSGRYRVRRDAGKPLDVLDTETEQQRAAQGLAPLEG
ncbi:hypothetical protein [Microterricola pindariensis]|uniref:Tetratrico peptide repeat group 5 domain-containing protein n=1 Tax=Microterricola pindariensis TaxID=478010 RepID=A0ABX5AU73_9MICO|nr:hypothetical protein [Microterricola pindariensis]PPL17334.1 hypothetical protein GY24_11590 [Microterricola pindariensis]